MAIKHFDDAQDEDYEDQKASDDESNDEILREDYDEMTLNLRATMKTMLKLMQMKSKMRMKNQ